MQSRNTRTSRHRDDNKVSRFSRHKSYRERSSKRERSQEKRSSGRRSVKRKSPIRDHKNSSNNHHKDHKKSRRSDEKNRRASPTGRRSNRDNSDEKSRRVSEGSRDKSYRERSRKREGSDRKRYLDDIRSVIRSVQRSSPGREGKNLRSSDYEKKRRVSLTDQGKHREHERSDDRRCRVSFGSREKSYRENDKSRVSRGEKRRSNDSRKTVKSKIQRVSKDSRGSERIRSTSPVDRRIPNEGEKSGDRWRDDRHKSLRTQDNGNFEAARISVARSHEEEDTSNKRGDGQRNEQNFNNKRKVEFVKTKSESNNLATKLFL